jgi:hypothetical protein
VSYTFFLLFQCDICAYFIEQRTPIHGEIVDNANLIYQWFLVTPCLRFLLMSAQKTPSHIHNFVENGNKILTAILEITGSLSLLIAKCVQWELKISGLSTYKSVPFSWDFKGENVGKHHMDHGQSGNLPHSSVCSEKFCCSPFQCSLVTWINLFPTASEHTVINIPLDVLVKHCSHNFNLSWNPCILSMLHRILPFLPWICLFTEFKWTKIPDRYAILVADTLSGSKCV